MMMLMVVVMAAAAALLVMIMLCFQVFFHQQILMFHSRHDLLALQLVPGRRDDRCGRVLFPQHIDAGLYLFIGHLLGTADHDGPRMLHLIVEKFSEIFHIHAALLAVYYRYGAVQFHRLVRGYAPDRSGHIRQLAHSGRLDQDTVRRIGLDHFFQRSAEISHQRAADTAGVHLRDLYSGFFQEPAVDTDLSEFILDQNNFFSGKYFLQQFLDQRSLSGSQEAGDNLNFCHISSFFLSY